MDELSRKLDEILYLLSSQREIMDIEQFSAYTGFSKDYVYKLTSNKIIPYYQPLGKKIYFKKSEIDEWILSNRHATKTEIKEKAYKYVNQNKN